MTKLAPASAFKHLFQLYKSLFQKHMGPSKGIFFMLVLLGIFVYLSSQCHTDPKYIVQGVKPILSPPFGTKKKQEKTGLLSPSFCPWISYKKFCKHYYIYFGAGVISFQSFLKYAQLTFLEHAPLFYMKCILFYFSSILFVPLSLQQFLYKNVQIK